MCAKKLAVFITAFNEERTIRDVLSSIGGPCDVFVIDDGSSDMTRAVSKKHGARVISHPINLGQGMAVVTAFKFLANKDYDIVIEMDGDGQHDPKEIPNFISKMEETGADVIAGSRKLGTDYDGAPFVRRLFLSPLTSVLNRLTGYEISDSMCGFRAFSGSALKRTEHLFDSLIETEYIASEMWIKFAKLGLKVSNVPIHLAGRKHGFSYKGLFRYGWGVVRAIVRAKLDVCKDIYAGDKQRTGSA
jgi:glycosyltransferase involved in cell wall biosynthesis